MMHCRCTGCNDGRVERANAEPCSFVDAVHPSQRVLLGGKVLPTRPWGALQNTLAVPAAVCAQRLRYAVRGAARRERVGSGLFVPRAEERGGATAAPVPPWPVSSPLALQHTMPSRRALACVYILLLVVAEGRGKHSCYPLQIALEAYGGPAASRGQSVLACSIRR